MVAVIGAADLDPEYEEYAEEIGAAVARGGFGLVCGGLGGVMAAACRGARRELPEGSGRIVGILPGNDKRRANPWVEIAVPSGLGIARNVLVVATADAVVAVGGASGTLSELALAWQLGVPICALTVADGWSARLAGESIDDKHGGRIHAADTVDEVARWLDRTLGPSSTAGDRP